MADHVAMAMPFRTKRTLPSPSAAFTPPVCRLRAALCCDPALLYGMNGSFVAPTAQLTMSGADEFGVLMVMNLNTPSSLWMSPRQSLSLAIPGQAVKDPAHHAPAAGLFSPDLTIDPGNGMADDMEQRLFKIDRGRNRSRDILFGHDLDRKGRNPRAKGT